VQALPYASVFLSYRRGEASAWATLLQQSLERRLPGISFFRDIDNIPALVKFEDHIRDAVGSCDVLIALIGPSWLTVKNEDGVRRLDAEDDFVRMEIGTAIARGIPIVPALVDGAVMPKRAALPAPLQELTSWQDHELPVRMWEESCDQLAESLRKRLSSTGGGIAPSASPVGELVGTPSVAKRFAISRTSAIAVLVVAALLVGGVFYVSSLQERDASTAAAQEAAQQAAAQAEATRLEAARLEAARQEGARQAMAKQPVVKQPATQPTAAALQAAQQANLEAALQKDPEAHKRLVEAAAKLRN
jgi:hypothetical protein